MIEFEMKVLSIHPAHDYKGERLICIEFGIENPAVQARNSFTTQTQQQAPLQVPLSNRLVLFLTISEWNSLKHKYVNEEMMSCQVNDNGMLTAQPLGRGLNEIFKEKIAEAKTMAEELEVKIKERTGSLLDENGKAGEKLEKQGEEKKGKTSKKKVNDA